MDRRDGDERQSRFWDAVEIIGIGAVVIYVYAAVLNEMALRLFGWLAS